MLAQKKAEELYVVPIFFRFIFLLSVTFFSYAAEAADLNKQFLKARLASGMSISLPQNWQILAGSEALAVSTSVAAVIDLTGYATRVQGVETILAANFPHPELYAAVTITVLKIASIKSTSATDFSDTDLKALEPQLRQGIEAIQLRLGEKVRNWTPMKKVQVGANQAFHVSYIRTSSAGDTLVHMYKFFGNGKVYDVALSTRVANNQINQPVLEKIVQSIVIDK